MTKRERGVNDQDLEQLSVLFRLLADKTRLSILVHLGDGERSVGDLCQVLGLPQPTISHHLGLLRMNNIVGNRRHGKQVIYTLNGGAGTHDVPDALMAFAVHNLQVEIRPRER